MLASLQSPDTWISLLTLCAMEIVLGIDNVIFIAILVARVGPENRERIRSLGLGLALVMRLGLLFALSWIMGLTEPLFSLLGKGFSGRDLILLFGGLFLVGKSAHEMFEKLEVGSEQHGAGKKGAASAAAVLAQILVLDIVFSLDSVITAVGMASQLWVMATAMIVSVIVMLKFAKPIGDFVERHPSMKILALSFLLLIGVLLVAEGFGEHVGKGYIYFAMAFALGVELVNMRVRKNLAPVHLHAEIEPEPGEQSAS
ncbi:MAG: TerC family protein [Pseudomonadota bacterium]|nr:TerC family protein [Pseudomonadota bacterium]